MSKLYKQTKMLVSRHYYHGGDGLEDLGLRFFHSMEEYEAEAMKHGWKEGGSFKTAWCTEPEELEVLVSQKDLARFKDGQSLSAEKVFFASTLATTVHQVGGWR